MIYDVRQNIDLDELIKEVNNRIIEGWEPLGGVQVRWYEFEGAKGEKKVDWKYLQTMVHKKLKLKGFI